MTATRNGTKRKTSTPPTISRSRALGDVQVLTSKLAREAAGVVQAVGGTGATQAALSTDLTSELNNIDFRKMIGAPLQAAVDAQVASSMATVDFINRVGFRDVAPDPSVPGAGQQKELIMVDFSHRRTDVNDAGDEVIQDVKITVPLLAMLPIPSLRIEHVIIDFNVKLNSVQSSKFSDALGVSSVMGGVFGPVGFKVSASYQRQTVTNVEVKKEYALKVNVKAVQDEIPAGLEKILNMLAA